MWTMKVQFTSTTGDYSTALSDGLATDCDIERISDYSFSIQLSEQNAKDLRAMWNTRMRGLIACDNILKQVLELRK